MHEFYRDWKWREVATDSLHIMRFKSALKAYELTQDACVNRALSERVSASGGESPSEPPRDFDP